MIEMPRTLLCPCWWGLEAVHGRRRRCRWTAARLPSSIGSWTAPTITHGDMPLVPKN